MLSSGRVKEFLTHPDQDVRSLAADYLSDGWSTDPDIFPLILDARDRYGDESYQRNLSRAKRFVITESTLNRLLEELEKAESEKVIDLLAELIVNAPVELLRERSMLLEAHPKLEPEHVEIVRHRLDYSTWPGERLWTELERKAKQCEKEFDETEEADTDEADALVEALGFAEFPDAETLCRRLADSEIKGSWIEIFLVSLVGRRRIVEAIPSLIDRLLADEDEDLLNEHCCEALARIGDVSIVGMLVNAYLADEGWRYKFSASHILGNLHFSESEQAILDLLKTETDDDVRTMLCVSLCELISDQAVDVVRKEIAAGSQGTFREAAPLALAVAEMLGQELPKGAVQWRREAKRQLEALRKAESEWENWSDLGGSEVETDTELSPDDAASPAVKPTQPIRNDEARVGRNDPCPCGSGKKYKKCCGGSR